MDTPSVMAGLMVPFSWKVRLRATEKGRATAYVRRQQFEVGRPVQFDEHDAQVSALEYVLAAIGADLINGFTALARRRHLLVDQAEVTVAGTLNNPLVHLSVVGEEGHPGLERVAIKLFVSADADEAMLRGVWQETIERSPLVRTLSPVVEFDLALEVTL